MRYEGHRTKHARRHDHGRPSTPHARHPGNVQGATAPMPARNNPDELECTGCINDSFEPKVIVETWPKGEIQLADILHFYMQLMNSYFLCHHDFHAEGTCSS